jgi:hypothetical protein
MKAKDPIKPRIKYHPSHQRGPAIVIRDDADNPLSSNFVPLKDRTEYDKARWWALNAKRLKSENPTEY